MTWAVAWRPLAERDLIDCAAHIAQDNIDAAVRAWGGEIWVGHPGAEVGPALEHAAWPRARSDRRRGRPGRARAQRARRRDQGSRAAPPGSAPARHATGACSLARHPRRALAGGHQAQHRQVGGARQNTGGAPAAPPSPAVLTPAKCSRSATTDVAKWPRVRAPFVVCVAHGASG